MNLSSLNPDRTTLAISSWRPSALDGGAELPLITASDALPILPVLDLWDSWPLAL